MPNLLKKIFIFFWNSYTRINLDFYLKKNFNVQKKITKKLEILIVKPFNYSDLYSPSTSSKIDTIKSSQYRMGPISLILDFKTKIAISDYSNNQKIGLKNLSENNKSKRYKYYKFLYNNKINTLEDIKQDVKEVFKQYNLTASDHTNWF